MEKFKPSSLDIFNLLTSKDFSHKNSDLLASQGSDSYFQKDDTNTSQIITFYTLASLEAIVGIFCISNSILLYRNGRFKNVALLFFYINSFLTLLCKILKTINANYLVRFVYFMDVVIDLGVCPYLTLKGLPSYTYATTAYCYITNW